MAERAREVVQYAVAGGHPPEELAEVRDEPVMILFQQIRAGVLDHRTVVFEIGGVARRMAQAGTGRNAGEEKMPHAKVAQMHVE